MSQEAAVAPSFPVPQVTLDDDAGECWELAAWIGSFASSDDFLRSFTSVLVALLFAPNGLSRWFLRYARAAGVQVEALEEARELDPTRWLEIAKRQESGDTPAGKPPHTSSVVEIAGGAAELASRTGASALGVRHLLGAYLYRLPSAHVKQMEDWGFDRARDGSAFIRQMSSRYPPELSAWVGEHETRIGGPADLSSPDPLPAPRISRFDPDTPEGEDFLDIEDDVYSLSALVCSTKVSPPLSIGLFGDWGSGKSFFIHRLRDGVSWISAQARESDRMQKEIPFFKHVVQIEFNAWQYSEGNLWASLVQHILDNLRLSHDDADDLVGKRREHLQQSMELEQVARSAAEARIAQAETESAAAETELEDLRKEHAVELTELEQKLTKDALEAELDEKLVSSLNEVRSSLGLDEAGAAAEEFLAAAEGTKQALQRASSLLTWAPPGQRKRFLVLSVAVIVLPLAFAAIAGVAFHYFEPRLGSVAAVIGWLSATLGLAARWLRQRTRSLNARVAELEGLRAKATRVVEQRRQAQQAEAAAIEQRIALLQQDIAAAQTRQREAATRLQELHAQLEAMTPGTVLADFIRERADSQDYRRYLGLPAVIHRDFQRISRMIADENRALEEARTLDDEKVGEEQRINRIVLYIDDLDRCSEERVVEVLAAVHLLLAFPLFVVVVAVDARWVSHALARRYAGLLHENGRDSTAPTPDDYLEKIFQIPFWVRPPDLPGVQRMVRRLLEEGPPKAVSGNGREPVDPAPVAPSDPPSAATGFRRRRHDPEARALDIQQAELDYIERLAPLLDRSPRALKRFVNIYRLLKASLPPEEQEAFLEASGSAGQSFETVLLLLAVITSLPQGSPVVLERLAKATQRAQAGGTVEPLALEALFGGLGGASADGGDESTRLEAWLAGRFGPDWRATDASPFLTWGPRTARFSYRLHRI